MVESKNISLLKVITFKINDEYERILLELQSLLSREIGRAVDRSDVIRMGIIALACMYGVEFDESSISIRKPHEDNVKASVYKHVNESRESVQTVPLRVVMR